MVWTILHSCEMSRKRQFIDAYTHACHQTCWCLFHRESILLMSPSMAAAKWSSPWHAISPICVFPDNDPLHKSSFFFSQAINLINAFPNDPSNMFSYWYSSNNLLVPSHALLVFDPSLSGITLSFTFSPIASQAFH